MKAGLLFVAVTCALATSVAAAAEAPAAATKSPFVVLGYNDLGMHCMNQDFSEFMILPPYNNLHAQVLLRSGVRPRIVSQGVTVSYAIPTNTHSFDKTNFWDYVDDLLGVSLAPDVGLTGNGMWGTMKPTTGGDWCVTGIPVTPVNDLWELDPYNVATITVSAGRRELAQTHAVVPVSWEISCWLCHNGDDAPSSVLDAHDQLHGTTLHAQYSVQGIPVLCGSCHAQPELGAPGSPDSCTLSSAVHTAHAARMDDVLEMTSGVACYACHPGMETQCFRDVHYQRGMTCTDCHASMEAVGDPSRRPWTDMPTCGGCHQKAGSRYEQASTLYRDSKGHGGVHCEACHGSPHAITPTVVPADNIQAIEHQGYAGTISDCRVCHLVTPKSAFRHDVPARNRSAG
ncbi:MAG: cytochrome c3 family protein [Armatimonadota bacterium]